MTIEHLQLYQEFIAQRGVGSNDKVADSQKSYVSYLNQVASKLDVSLSPDNLRSDDDVLALKGALKGKISDKTISNYGSALKQYVAMVQYHQLRVKPWQANIRSTLHIVKSS